MIKKKIIDILYMNISYYCVILHRINKMRVNVMYNLCTRDNITLWPQKLLKYKNERGTKKAADQT